jgi:hypothetical protein
MTKTVLFITDPNCMSPEYISEVNGSKSYSALTVRCYRAMTERQAPGHEHKDKRLPVWLENENQFM